MTSRRASAVTTGWLVGTGWFAAPAGIFEDSRLTMPDREVLFYLCRRAAADGFAFPGIDMISAATTIPIRTLRRVLPHLESCGWLSREPLPADGRPGRPRVAYRLQVPGGFVPTWQKTAAGFVPTAQGFVPRDLQIVMIDAGKPLELDQAELDQASPDKQSFSPLEEQVQELPNGKKEKLPSEVAALVDLFRVLPGIQPSRKDGGVIADLFKRYGAAAVRRTIEEDGPTIAAADNPLMYLASRFKRSRGGPPGETVQDRAARYAETLRRMK